MKTSRVLRSLLPVLMVVLTFASNDPSHAQLAPAPGKPPEVISGGEWTDDFWQGKLQEAENIDVQVSHLLLKYTEQLHWTQTWTEHFAEGEFWQTEAISDSVRLAWNAASQEFYTTGIYTSTVFYAGRPVDWAYATWRFTDVPENVFIQFRTGETPTPDDGWTGWMVPRQGFFEFICAYTQPVGDTDCSTNLDGINSSPYIQYRASFTSDHPGTSVALTNIDFLYGIHCLSGSALSIPIPPADLREWESVIVSATTPADTTLVIDVLATDGTVLIPDIHDGSSLEGIDAHDHPAIQLRASLTTSDPSVSPDIQLWGLKWAVWYRQYLPVTRR
jgi:hypothetical protein